MCSLFPGTPVQCHMKAFAGAVFWMKKIPVISNAGDVQRT
jgi:hypothetical protein